MPVPVFQGAVFRGNRKPSTGPRLSALPEGTFLWVRIERPRQGRGGIPGASSAHVTPVLRWVTTRLVLWREPPQGGHHLNVDANEIELVAVFAEHVDVVNVTVPAVNVVVPARRLPIWPAIDTAGVEGLSDGRAA